ncbi:PAP2-domain-containing protein [Violaceomyces palustris]|uniref:PAP2-domain-containing protein n=1 Tax=Violaceomyces palustris TaxID=1673888 RepID=A0ACD0P7M6_9BASI|nr:PAP2-domain-containing protein [Violaceomyces palustris]
MISLFKVGKADGGGAGGSSIDPSNFASLTLTHVRYNPHDPLAKFLSLVTLSPIFLLCSYVTIILYRRELTFINALIGQLGCEGVNWGLKRLIRQPRPTVTLGSGYGMPSSHSQFIGFFATFFLAHFSIHRPPNRSTFVGPDGKQHLNLINIMRRVEHLIAMVIIALLAILTCYSRYHLNYHTPAQIFVGFFLGSLIGGVYYYITEYLSRKPLRLPSPLGTVTPTSSPISTRNEQKASILGRQSSNRSNTNPRRRKDSQKMVSDPSSSEVVSRGSQGKRRRRSSTFSDFMPELHPAPPLRQMILDHPLAVAFRLRDGWTVWKDGGIEGEYGAWRREWEKRRKDWRPPALADVGERPTYHASLAGEGEDGGSEDGGPPKLTSRLQASVPILKKQPGKIGTREGAGNGQDVHYEMMKVALLEADKSIPLKTAFCVGCVITLADVASTNGRPVILSTGYSRELEGNTHAEQCALEKLEGLLMRIEGDGQGDDQEEVEELALNLYTTMEPCYERLSGNLPCVDRILRFNDGNHQRSSGRGNETSEVEAEEKKEEKKKKKKGRLYLVPEESINKFFPSLSASSPALEDEQGGEGKGRSERTRRSPNKVRLHIRTVHQGVKEPDDFVSENGAAKLLRNRGIQVHTVSPPKETRREASKAEEDWLEMECLRIAKKGHDDEPLPVGDFHLLWRG